MLKRRLALPVLGVSCLVLLTACSTVGYYTQAIGGHLALMRDRVPIADVLARENTPAALREKLHTLLDARSFAVDVLALPDNASYTSYVQTNRRYVTWNVVATDEFSLEAHTWCFPIAGCVSYRGYFEQADARAYARHLASAGADVSVGGALAYSTLGWFDDPVLDTMLNGGDLRYVGTLFHELAHQILYVKSDSDFNEAFASFVEQEGLRHWLEARGETIRVARYDLLLERASEFADLLDSTRSELLALYAEDLPHTVRRQRKTDTFVALEERYAQLRRSWGGYSGYDGWFSRELNNARLVSVSTYRRLLPAFAVLFDESGRDFQRFYQAAERLAGLPDDQRRARMAAYLERAA